MLLGESDIALHTSHDFSTRNHPRTSEVRFSRWHPTSGESYHRSTAKGTVSTLQPSDGMILVTGPRLEDDLPRFFAIQTHPSCRFHLAVDFPGLRAEISVVGQFDEGPLLANFVENLWLPEWLKADSILLWMWEGVCDDGAVA